MIQLYYILIYDQQNIIYRIYQCHQISNIEHHWTSVSKVNKTWSALFASRLTLDRQIDRTDRPCLLVEVHCADVEINHSSWNGYLIVTVGKHGYQYHAVGAGRETKIIFNYLECLNTALLQYYTFALNCVVSGSDCQTLTIYKFQSSLT